MSTLPRTDRPHLRLAGRSGPASPSGRPWTGRNAEFSGTAAALVAASLAILAGLIVYDAGATAIDAEARRVDQELHVAGSGAVGEGRPTPAARTVAGPRTARPFGG